MEMFSITEELKVYSAKGSPSPASRFQWQARGIEKGHTETIVSSVISF